MQVEDFLDRSQNFARSVGKVQMQKICKCLRECALNLLDFMRGKMDIMKLRTLLFGRLSPDELGSKPRLEHVKRKRKWGVTPQGRCVFQKSAQHGGSATSSDSLPTANKVLPHALQANSLALISLCPLFDGLESFLLVLAMDYRVGFHLLLLTLAREYWASHQVIYLNQWSSTQLVHIQQKGPLLPTPHQHTCQQSCSGAYGAEQLRHNDNVR